MNDIPFLYEPVCIFHIKRTADPVIKCIQNKEESRYE